MGKGRFLYEVSVSLAFKFAHSENWAKKEVGQAQKARAVKRTMNS